MDLIGGLILTYDIRGVRKRVSPGKYILALRRAAGNREEDGTPNRGWSFAGAIYHVLSRGNYRKKRFDTAAPGCLRRHFLRPERSAANCSMRRR